jgi:capsular exopolysaccharide synthesis family protein
MSIDEIASTLWRRRVSFLLTLLACVAAVVAVTFLLPKTYTATATVYVGGRVEPGTFVDTQLIEQHTRTYSTLAGNPNVADAVVEELDEDMTREELLERMAFAPVERTQLLLISAEARSRGGAAEIANTYADTFVSVMTDLYEDGKAPAEIAVSEPAAPPDRASRPNPPLYLGFGTLLAIFLALGVALLRERLDTRVRVAADDDTVLGQPIMARIPTITTADGQVARSVLDRFALLKTNIDFFDENPARVVVVTSPGVNEGKSTVAANLALACAADGERVALIEGDLRRPGLGATVIGESVARSPVGLSNYLASAADEERILTPHPDNPDLRVIWAGLIPPNPTALLGSHRLDTLIEALRLDHDRIIIDTCPISVGADASVIASRVDGALYVMDERKTKRSEAQAGLNQLRSVRAHLLGVVLNRARLSGDTGYYDYYADHPPDDSERPARRAGRSESFS